MAGLVPAIHVFDNIQGVDARHKAGHDGVARPVSQRPYASNGAAHRLKQACTLR